MRDYFKEEIEKTSYEFLRENSPGIIEIIHTLIGADYSTEAIISICCEKSGRSAGELAFIGCACDFYKRIANN